MLKSIVTKMYFSGHIGERRCCLWRIFKRYTKREDGYPQYSSGGIGFSLENNCFDKDGNLVTVERVYLGVANHPERSILVWEKGMEIRPATAEEEERYSYLKNPN